MFEDVMEDFHEFHHIKARFEDWKRKQRDSYEEAFIGLCLPKLFTPLVRLYLINWNPLEVKCMAKQGTRHLTNSISQCESV